MLSKKASLQQDKLNAKILWYSFNPQYNKSINADVKNTALLCGVDSPFLAGKRPLEYSCANKLLKGR